MTNFYMEDQKRNKILVDASFFIAVEWKNDPNHLKAEDCSRQLTEYSPIFVTNNYITAEILSVLLIRLKSLKHIKDFGRRVYGIKSPALKIYQVTQLLQEEAYKIFKNQKKYKKGFLSFFDCTLIAQARKQKIKTILTFDKTFRQFKKEGIKVLP